MRFSGELSDILGAGVDVMHDVGTVLGIDVACKVQGGWSWGWFRQHSLWRAWRHGCRGFQRQAWPRGCALANQGGPFSTSPIRIYVSTITS